MADARAAGEAGHVVPVRIYLLVFGALLSLTAATVGAALVDLKAHLEAGGP